MHIYKDCIVNRNSEIVLNDGTIIFEDSRMLHGKVDNLDKHRARFATEDIGNLLKGKSFYAGISLNHFGHFLLESLSRLSNFEHDKFDQIVWCSVQDGFNSWQKEILNILSLGDVKHTFLTRNTPVEELYVSDRNFIIWDEFSPTHVNFMSKVDDNCNEFLNKKVWISRLNKEMKNEYIIEYFLKKSGWLIVNPVEYSVLQQAQLFNSADLISGIEGSAFHAMILSGNCTDNVKVFNRWQGDITPSYPLISIAKRKNHEFISVTRSNDYLDVKEVLTCLDVDFDIDVLNILESLLEKEKEKEKAKEITDRDKIIGAVRDLSVISHQLGEINLALSLMEIAYRERPSGPFIKAKLDEYKKELSELDV